MIGLFGLLCAWLVGSCGWSFGWLDCLVACLCWGLACFGSLFGRLVCLVGGVRGWLVCLVDCFVGLFVEFVVCLGGWLV